MALEVLDCCPKVPGFSGFQRRLGCFWHFGVLGLRVMVWDVKF